MHQNRMLAGLLLRCSYMRVANGTGGTPQLQFQLAMERNLLVHIRVLLVLFPKRSVRCLQAENWETSDASEQLLVHLIGGFYHKAGSPLAL